MAVKNSSIYGEWMWKSNLNPDKRSEKVEWTNYLDEECEMIEEAYQNGETRVELKTHYIDLTLFLQFNKADPTRQRPVKRIEHNKESWISDAKKIGAGYFGTVYQGIFRGTQEVAYKVIKGQLSQAAQTEANILKTLRHPNIVQYIDIIHTKNHTILVMEFIDGDTLCNYIRKMPNSFQYWHETRDKMLNVAFALSYLHEKNVVHADLKSDNILLRSNGAAILSDFGLSIVVKDSHARPDKSHRGAIRWLAPELCSSRSEITSFASDVWAFGCVLIEIMTRQVPWSEFSTNQQVLAVLADESNAKTFQANCRNLDAPEKIRKLLYACCAWSKSNRPDFAKIIKDLNSITKVDLERQSDKQSRQKDNTQRPSSTSYLSLYERKTRVFEDEPSYDYDD